MLGLLVRALQVLYRLVGVALVKVLDVVQLLVEFLEGIAAGAHRLNLLCPLLFLVVVDVQCALALVCDSCGEVGDFVFAREFVADVLGLVHDPLGDGGLESLDILVRGAQILDQHFVVIAFGVLHVRCPRLLFATQSARLSAVYLFVCFLFQERVR